MANNHNPHRLPTWRIWLDFFTRSPPRTIVLGVVGTIAAAAIWPDAFKRGLSNALDAILGAILGAVQPHVHGLLALAIAVLAIWVLWTKVLFRKKKGGHG